MKRTNSGLAVIALVFAASVALAQAQTADDHTAHHADGQDAAQASPAMAMPSQDGMPMQMGGKPGAMGGDMGQMMEMSHSMMERGGMGMKFEHVEGRIAYLKAELQITGAQEARWTVFADAMRGNAAMMKTMHQQMAKSGMAGALPERLAAQQAMMSAHIAMLERLQAGATPLYAALSAEQRDLIDQMTAGPMGMM